MFPYTFETVTAITLIVIGIILALYFTVLKRKGWLTENSNESFYLCPNPECKKIFQKPIMLTDLSEEPPRVRKACPHCGLELGAVSPFRVQKKPEMAVKIPLSPEEPLVRVKTPKPVMSVESLDIPENPLVAEDTQKPLAETPERVEAQNFTEEEQPPTTPSKLQARPAGCSHFLGYLKKFPKNTSIPDECFGCLKMIECLYYEMSE